MNSHMAPLRPHQSENHWMENCPMTWPALRPVSVPPTRGGKRSYLKIPPNTDTCCLFSAFAPAGLNWAMKPLLAMILAESWFW